MNKFSGKIYIVYDGMWGSCGKGKFCGTFARDPKFNIQVCVNNNAPNAGHSFVFDNGQKVVTRHLPIGVVNPNIPYLVIGESAVIDVNVLKDELIKYKELIAGRKIYISDTAAIILEKHKQTEKQMLKTGSTLKGTGAALVDKIMRQEGNIARNSEELLALQEEGLIKLVDSKTFFPCIYHGLAGFRGDENILVECAQGDALSMNSANYPYTTSRDCCPAQAIKDIHATDYSKNIIKYCVFRPYPIRINNQSETGYNFTGHFLGAKEISWETVSERSGLPAEWLKVHEQTTVTKRLRRVAEFSIRQFQEMLLDTTPDVCILNFAEYINSEMIGLTQADVKKVQNKLVSAIKNGKEYQNEKYYQINLAIQLVLDYIDDMKTYFEKLLKNSVKVNISLIGTGEKESEIIKTSSLKRLFIAGEHKKAKHPLDFSDKDNFLPL